MTIDNTVSITITGASSSAGACELRSDAANPPTTVRCAQSASQAFSGTVVVGVALTQRIITQGILGHLVPPGQNVRLAASGAGTALAYASEVAL